MCLGQKLSPVDLLTVNAGKSGTGDKYPLLDLKLDGVCARQVLNLGGTNNPSAHLVPTNDSMSKSNEILLRILSRQSVPQNLFHKFCETFVPKFEVKISL